MTAKRKSEPKKPTNQVPANAKPNDGHEQALARTVLRPTVNAAVTVREYGRTFGDLDLEHLIEELFEQTKTATRGDLGRGEAMLAAQAHTLDAIFNKLAQKAIRAEYMHHFDAYMKFALRAQSQARATWEALSVMKHPTMVGYVNQANIAHGPQQVNNVQPSEHIESDSAAE